MVFAAAAIEFGWSGRGSNHMMPLFIKMPASGQHDLGSEPRQQRVGERHHRAVGVHDAEMRLVHPASGVSRMAPFWSGDFSYVSRIAVA